jgi:hypothetical protein
VQSEKAFLFNGRDWRIASFGATPEVVAIGAKPTWITLK